MVTYDITYPEKIIRHIGDFFETTFQEDVDQLKKGVKHPAHEMSQRIFSLVDSSAPVGIDLPVLLKPRHTDYNGITVVLLGQDPRRIDTDVDMSLKETHAFIGTPYRIHHTEGLYGATLVNIALAERLTSEGYGVYLTDVVKYFKQRRNTKSLLQANEQLLVDELKALGGNILPVLSGKRAQNAFANIMPQLNVQVCPKIDVPHLSSNWAMKDWCKLTGSARKCDKINYVINQIRENEKAI